MNQSVIFLEPKGTLLEVVRCAKKRGYKIIALTSDRSLIEGAPEPYRTAIPLIDQVITIPNWNETNENRIQSICEEINSQTPIVGIFAGMDPCAVILAKLRARYGLPTPDPKDVALVLNKFSLRRRLVELGLSHIRNYSSTDVKSWIQRSDWVPGKPVYFKPVHGFFSAYVKRCENLQDLREAQSAWDLQNAQNTVNSLNSYDPRYVRNYLQLTGDYHVEEAFDGELLSVEALASRGEIHVLGLLSRILYSKNPVVEMGSCFPYPHPLADKIIGHVSEALKKLGLTDGPTHTELIVNSNGEIEIIDLNPRFVGADVLQSINHAYGIKIEETLLEDALGKPIQMNPTTAHFSCLQYFLPPSVPVFESVEFPEQPEVLFHTNFIKPGTPIVANTRQIDYLGCYLTVMPTFESAVNRSRELRNLVRINQIHPGVY